MKTAKLLSFLTLLSALFFLGCASDPYQKGLAPADTSKDPYHHQSHFKGVGGVNLYAQWWTPAGNNSKAVVIFVHGLKDHSRRYAETAEKLTAKNYSVYAFDLRGHGDSEGQRVWVDSFDDYVNDLQTYYDLVKKKEPNKPIYIFGHSMGGAIVTLFSLRHSRPVAGMILSGPALRLDANGFTKFSAKMIGTIMPSLAILKLNEDDFSRDPKTVEATKADPLVYHPNGPAHTAKELFNATSEIQDHMMDVDTPFIILHGQKDLLTMYEGSTDLFQKARSKIKSLKLYPLSYHDLLHEPEKDKVFGDMLTWLEAQTSAALPTPASPSTTK